MAISYNGYKNNILTFEKSEQEIAIGYPVGLDDMGRAVNAKTSENFIGICVSERINCVGVQTDGYIEMKYEGTAPKYGLCGLVASGNDSVTVCDLSDAAKAYTVLKVDDTNRTVGFLL